MSNICKHYTMKYLERICTDCGARFYICPVCCKTEPYSWCCLECERKAKRAARVGGVEGGVRK